MNYKPNIKYADDQNNQWYSTVLIKHSFRAWFRWHRRRGIQCSYSKDAWNFSVALVIYIWSNNCTMWRYSEETSQLLMLPTKYMQQGQCNDPASICVSAHRSQQQRQPAGFASTQQADATASCWQPIEEAGHRLVSIMHFTACILNPTTEITRRDCNTQPRWSHVWIYWQYFLYYLILLSETLMQIYK